MHLDLNETSSKNGNIHHQSCILSHETPCSTNSILKYDMIDKRLYLWGPVMSYLQRQLADEKDLDI